MSESSIQGIHGSYLMPHFDHATVADAMHPGILSCEPDASLTEVARMMSTRHVHCIVIKAADDGPGDEPPLWGLVSDLDVVRAGLRPDAPETAVELAVKPVIKIETTAALRDAAQLMLDKGASHVVAVNPASERPVGILSTLDIAGVIGWGEM
ncbi:MAG TPA: CBS domain-containing protein [Solirubrobacteraceae bacterium]|nr:CBS domain-containing protein [Solirubrobacteraceae bacterium]